MTVQEAASSLSGHLNPHRSAGHWLIGVGTGDRRIIAFVESERWLDKVPPEWEGFPVEVRASGRLMLYQAGDSRQ